jgi:multiple sugar transport system substrate-binding protein
MNRRLFGAIAAVLALTGFVFAAPAAADWSLEQASAPYRGTELNMILLDRPGYRAIIKLLPDFERRTGIKVNFEINPYENTRDKEILNFTMQGKLTIALVDIVWIGEFAEKGWIVPIDRFTANPALTDPKLDLKGFFPLLLDALGSWDGRIYGLPFDNYSGLLFYNACMLKAAGFDRPPETWDELLRVYAPKLTDPARDQYAFALQSLRGETQSADSFMRVLWPFGGSLLDPAFHSNLKSPESQAGLQFRQKLLPYMPPGAVSYDHAEAINALAQERVAMITDWSAFYGVLTDLKASKLGDCLGVAPEPKGPAGRKPALGGFSLAVASQAPAAAQEASWLFIQWATSEDIARAYIEAGGVSARMAVYQQPDLQARFSFLKPMVESWQVGVPNFRPRFPAWPAISDIIAEWGTKMELGKVTTEQGADEIGRRMEAVLSQQGYYDGKRALLQ